MTGLTSIEYAKLAIYYASYVYFIAAPIAVWVFLNRAGALRYLAGGFLLVISLLAYGRFVEPRILLRLEHNVSLSGCFETTGKVRIAVFSDTHNGLFRNAMPVNRIVEAVNAANADFTLIAGDFIYFLDPRLFKATFATLGSLNGPAYAVLGNHDLGIPGPDLSESLTQILPELGVRLIDNSSIQVASSRFEIELVGLSDQWAGNQRLSLLDQASSIPRIVLTHNPATVRDFEPQMSADLLIGGHTHGGQIQLPFLTCKMTGVCGDVAYGLREESGLQIFTTSGTGMVGLPMRFRTPPRVDVLEVRWIGGEDCRANQY